MEGVVQGGRFPNYVNLQKQPLVPPPLTAIGRFLQGQTSRNNYPLHNYDFSSSTNGRIDRLYNESRVSLVSNCVFMDNFFGTNQSSFSKNDQNQSNEHNNDVIKFGKTINTKRGGRKYLIKGQWTDEEDRKLCRLVKQHGVRKWAQIAEQMIGRAGKQCRERWHNHLRPDIKKDTWCEDEERMLVEAHRKVGNKWAEIAKIIPGRTENAIKNHWNATKRRQNSRRKIKKNESMNTKSRLSVLQDYIRSENITNPSEITTTHVANATTTFDDPYPKLNNDILEQPNLNSNESPSLDITQSYEGELIFMQRFFGDSNHIVQDSNTTSCEPLVQIKGPKSSLNMNINSQYGFSPYSSSMSNESVHINDLKSSLDVKPLGVSCISQNAFASSSSISNDSSFQISPKSSMGMHPLGFSDDSLYGFDSSSSLIPHGKNSNLCFNEDDSLKPQLAPDVYISYILEGSTTLYSSSEYEHYEDNQRGLVFEAEKGGSDCSSNHNQDMDLMEMVLSSQFS